MLDLKFLRNNVELVKAALAKKKFAVNINEFIEIDNARRGLLTKFETLRAKQKSDSEELNKLSKLSKLSEAFKLGIIELKNLSKFIKDLEAQVNEIQVKWDEAYLCIPNLPHESVPVGKNEKDNVTLRIVGNVDSISKYAIPHYDIPWFSNAIDFPRGVKVTGAGFPFYIGDMARLVRALLTFFLDEARANGYIELMTPIMVNTASATATGQLPDKERQMYHDAHDDFYLIPTAEVPVTNFFRGEIFEESALPIKRCAYTPCFRREAGSWGKDVRGLNRLHQFDKVELVKWAHPDNSFDELESLRNDAESILQKLEIPYRVLAICTGDIGFPHSKQYDLEVWAGGQKRWLEVSSCSNFTDFQARRAGIKFKPSDGSKSRTVHTLNGSGLAIPRVLAAILENNLQADGSIEIPKAIRHLLGGVEFLFGDLK